MHNLARPYDGVLLVVHHVQFAFFSTASSGLRDILRGVLACSRWLDRVAGLLRIEFCVSKVNGTFQIRIHLQYSVRLCH